MIDPNRLARQRVAVELRDVPKGPTVRARCVSCGGFVQRRVRRCPSCVRALSPAGLRHATLPELLELHRALEVEIARRVTARTKRAG